MAKNKQAQAKQAGPSKLITHMIGQQSVRSEGHAMPMHHLTPGKAGVNIANAPVPQRRYSAEICSVIADNTGVKIVFGQSKLFGDGLDSAVVIRMSPVAVIQFADSLKLMRNPGVIEILKGVSTEPEALSEITSHPEQVAHLIANMVSVASAGYETCMDFYHASAFAMKKAESSSSLEIEPGVRIDLRTSVFATLAARIEELGEQFAKQLGGKSE